MNSHHSMHHHGMPANQYSSESGQPHNPGHMSHSSVSSAASAPSYYQPYSHQPQIHNGMPSYGSQSMALPGYPSYANGIHAMNSGLPPAGALQGTMIQSQPNVATLGNSGGPHNPPQAGHSDNFDTTGQIAPPGVKPRVTATLWEDEGSLCFQVETNGICVARREDNHMINGTKLLNVAGMTRGRRDGILKSEKNRAVVKIGPMHLKGVWIPFERALDFANREKITDKLYPLFVHNISQLLYHPSNSAARASLPGSVAPQTQRRLPESEQNYGRDSKPTQAPPLQHHHSMSGPLGGQDDQTDRAAVTQPTTIRPPPAQRSQTLPTPPTTSAGAGAGAVDWSAHASQLPSAGLQVDTNNIHGRSQPETPNTTPPDTMGYQTSGAYDTSRTYSHSAHPSYSSTYNGLNRYSQLQSSPSVKHEMGPPMRMGHDQENKYASHAHDQLPSSEVGDNDHDNNDYTHSAGPYSQHRSNYGYVSQAQAPVPADQQVSSDLTGSPQKNSGRSTPRAAPSYGSYGGAQRTHQMPSSNIYNTMNDHSSMANGSDMYGSGYPANSYSTPSNKRSFEADDDENSTNSIKRQRTIHDDASRPMIATKKR